MSEQVESKTGTPPWPYPWPIDEHCFAHDEHEPILPDDYQTCGECWHTFRTKEELEAAHEEMAGDRIEASGIFACPLCAHDF